MKKKKKRKKIKLHMDSARTSLRAVANSHWDIHASLILISCQSTDFLPSCDSASVIITSIHKELLPRVRIQCACGSVLLQVQLIKLLQQNPIVLAFDV